MFSLWRSNVFAQIVFFLVIENALDAILKIIVNGRLRYSILRLSYESNPLANARKPWISLKFVTIPTEIRTAPEDFPSMQ